MKTHTIPNEDTERDRVVSDFFRLDQYDQERILRQLIRKANGQEVTTFDDDADHDYHLLHIFSRLQEVLSIPSKEDFDTEQQFLPPE